MADDRTYLLGLDAGNTVIKAVLFDLAGRQVAMSALDGQSFSPAPGHVERDLGELWRNAQTVIRECLDKAGVESSQIAAANFVVAGKPSLAQRMAGASTTARSSLPFLAWRDR